MLSYERRVVDALVAPLDPGLREPVTAYVEGTLRAMPEHLRAGVAGESLLLGSWSWARSRLRRTPQDATADLTSMERSPVGLVRQYPRLLRSLVLFASHELEPARPS